MNWRVLAVTPDGRRAVAGGVDIAAWDLTTGELLQAWPGDNYYDWVRRTFGMVQDVAVTSDGACLAVCWNHTPLVDLLDVRDANRLVARAYFDTPVSRLAWSPSGDSLYCGDAAGNVFCLQGFGAGIPAFVTTI
jgi:WD40 repeat protein